MSFWELLKIEFIKVKRSKIIPLIFIAPLLVVASGVANLHSYFTPEYTNAWAAVLLFYLFMEMVVFLAVFVIAGLLATSGTGITETLPIMYLLKWCCGLFLTMLPSVTTMWAITVLFDKPLLSVGLNMFLVIPGVLVANTPLWIAYPYCYSGYLVSCSLRDFTTIGIGNGFQLFPFLPCAIVIFVFAFWVAITRFGKKEMR